MWGSRQAQARYIYDNPNNSWTMPPTAGNLVKQRDARNQAICFYYDNLNRLVGKTYHADTPNLDALTCAGSYVVSYGYDAYDGSTQFGIGRRTAMTDPSGSTAWVYDVRGRVKQTTQTITERGTFVTQWGYDAADRPVWQKYPADNTGQVGEQVNYGYNAAGQLTSVAGQATYVSSTTYDTAGRLDVRTLGNGLAPDYDYYPWTQSGGRLQRIRTGNLLDLQYPEYDANGNVKRIVDAVVGQTQEFSYDALDRLLTASASGGSVGLYTETYAYAANGNLISKTGVGSYGYNAAVSGCSAGTPGTKPHAVAQAGNSAYRYDCNGNMTARAGQVLRYDQENRLAQVIGEAVTTYRYNGDGGRVALTTGCTTTTYVGAYFEWRGSAATSTSYYYAGGMRVAMRTGTPLTGTINYLLGDHLGSTSVSYRSDGSQTVTQRYSPWGSVRATTGGVLPTDYTFTGQKLDASAGLLYYGARYYDSALGRFIQADTIVPEPGNPQALNRYSYVLNSPLKLVDPSGHQGLPPGIPNPYNWLGQKITGIDSSQLPEETGLQNLTTDIGKVLVGAIDKFNRVVAPAVEFLLGLFPGYDVVTAAVGTNMTGEELSPGQRVAVGALGLTAFGELKTAGKVAFGLGRPRGAIGRFAQQVKAVTYWDLYESASDLKVMGKQLLDMMHGAQEIHFNLDSMIGSGQTVHDIARIGQEGLREGNITNWELYTILTNQDLFEKATFYLNGKIYQGVTLLTP